MRTPTLQYLYLQKPVTMMVVICIISVLPWIGLGDFSTKGEPREAAVAISMLETGNWVLPQSYANEFAFKPPMAHWLMAAFSYPQGYVSEFTSRLPSALAFITLIGFVLVFFGKRIVKFQEAFIATLLLVTCVEIHRAAMTTRVDMLLTTFIVIGLFQLYRWEDKLELKGLPISRSIYTRMRHAFKHRSGSPTHISIIQIKASRLSLLLTERKCISIPEKTPRHLLV